MEQPKLAIIMRGISGSGKSTVAEMLSEAMNGSIHSTDKYFMSEAGVYNFNPKELGANHIKNQEAFKADLEQGVPVVICDNTNTKNWEMEAYVKSAQDAGYWVVYVTMPHPEPKVAVERNSHNVPEFAINKMIENWEPIKHTLSGNSNEQPFVLYTALFVQDTDELLNSFEPKHANVYGHHSTIAFKPQGLEGIEVGKKGFINVIGRACDEKGDALLVENKKSNNEHPHITLSCTEGTKPFYSNQLIKKADEMGTIEYFDKPIKIAVTEGYFNGKEDVLQGCVVDSKKLMPKN